MLYKILNRFQQFDNYYIPPPAESPDDTGPAIGIIYSYAQI